MKKVSVIIPEKLGTISPEIYGHFSEHIGGVFYGGLWVGKNSDIPNIKGFRKDAIEALEKINPPVLRWPGGCFAEIYDWRDGIGENRPIRTNWWTLMTEDTKQTRWVLTSFSTSASLSEQRRILL